MCEKIFFKQTKKMANFGNATLDRATRTRGGARGGGGIGRGGLENLDFFGPKWHSLRR
jgi:hypothetical protein